MSSPVTIRPVVAKADRKAFIDFAWEVYKDDPHWVPPLKDEVHGLITAGKNPWFEHAKAQLWLAERGGTVVGRISAQVDELVQKHMGQGIGNWGMFEALDAEAATALIAAGERNSRIRIRQVDKGKFNEEARTILNLLNDAWSHNWGYVPLTESEIAYAGKKLKPIIYNELVRIAEVDGEPVAFMLTIPDINELIKDLNGELFPFNWAKLLWRLRKPRVARARVPLMGVAKKLHQTRMASMLAFMLIEFTRRDCVGKFGINTGEFGWILEDNKGMLSIAELPGARINHRYRIFEKTL